MSVLIQVDGSETGSDALISAGSALTDISLVLLAVVGAWLLTRAVRVVLRVGMRHLAARARAGKSRAWRVRLPRILTESSEEMKLRRDLRVDATALVLSRMASAGIWFLTTLFVIHALGLSVSLALTGAGFLGFALAIGGQHTIHDFITGLHVLLEDRCGVGDEIDVRTTSGEHIRGMVTSVGAFTTRLDGDGGVWHLANHTLNEVCNHSQRGIPTEIEVGTGRRDQADDEGWLAAAVHDAFDDVTSGHVIIDDIEPAGDLEASPRYRISLRTKRTLSDDERARFAHGVERRVT